MTDWTPQRFIDWGGSIDAQVKELIIKVLERKNHPEQAYKSCMGILSLEKKVGRKRFINACRKALEYNIDNYMAIKHMLEKNMETPDEADSTDETPPDHENIRGNEYYQ
jgi:hypothetical protein